MSEILGVDVSWYQASDRRYPPVKPWQPEIAKAAGARFAIIRSGSADGSTGTPYADYEWERNLRALDVLPTSCYWYFRPNFSPARQADYWCKLVEPYYSRLVDMWADVEENGKLSAEAVAQNLGAFLERVKKNLGEYPGIYTRASFWNPNVAKRSLWGKLRLWIALYNPVVKHPWEGLNKLYKPRDWDKPLIWQWSADGNGRGREFGAQSNSIDINRFMGTEIEFEAYINRKQAQPDPQPDPTPALTIEQRLDRLEAWAISQGMEP
jgi:GH25 family lysozyme M1 (1,4-beta-N-acetylmuramidase)